MRLKKFEFISPDSLKDVLQLMRKDGEKLKVIAGGTDLLVQMKDKLITPEKVVNLLNVPELSGVEKNGKGLRVGALTKHAVLESAPEVKEGWRILADAAHKVGSPQIRNLGTIGGNLCNASPAADTAPALLVLEAEAILVSQRGERRILLDSFFAGPGMTVMEKDEILKEIFLLEVPANSLGAYLKLGRRKSLDLALVSVAVLLTMDSGSGICQRARVALGAVSPVPMRAKETEKFLEGKELKESLIREAGEVAQKEFRPISDIRATAEYRREMVKVLAERAIKKSLGLPIPPTGI
ncbi:MAG: xanthine dehydrogenase family protein subunit M [Thermodesulfobacteriota bacterium]|nr:xanthine dehydrogenase family protein subunit M [Thermodesulfobacteriota bacterium]